MRENAICAVRCAVCGWDVETCRLNSGRVHVYAKRHECDPAIPASKVRELRDQFVSIYTDICDPADGGWQVRDGIRRFADALLREKGGGE